MYFHKNWKTASSSNSVKVSNTEGALLTFQHSLTVHCFHAENHSAPPDVTGYSSDSSHSHAERHPMSNMGTIARNTQKYGNAERMETGDGKAGRPCCAI